MKLELEYKIAAAIVRLLSMGITPSNRKILNITGGSLAYIQPIFKELKIRFKDFTDLKALCKAYKLAEFNPGQLITKNQDLQKQLAAIEAVNFKLEQELSQLQTNLQHSDEERLLFKKLYAELKDEREAILFALKKEKEEQVNSLLQELAEVHQAHSKEYRDFSYNKEEQVLQKEVEIINLKSKLQALEEQLKSYQQHNLPQARQLKELKQENLKLTTQVFNLEQKLKEVNND